MSALLRLLDDSGEPAPSDEPAEYRAYLRELGLSDKTVYVYVQAMVRADAWFEARGHRLVAAPGPLLAEYADTLPRSHSTRHHLRAALRHLWTWHGRARPPLWAVKVPKVARMVCRALSPEDAARLALRATERADAAGLAVLVGLYAAFRVAEIAAMRWEDVDHAGAWLRVVGKGDVEAVVPLHPELARALAAHEVHRGPGAWVFPGRLGGGHIHPSTIWGWTKELAAEAGIASFTTHQLRSTCLAQALDVTRDLRAVRDLARHAHVATTEGYTRTTEERLRAASRALSYGPQAAQERPEVPPAATGLGGWLERHRDGAVTPQGPIGSPPTPPADDAASAVGAARRPEQ